MAGILHLEEQLKRPQLHPRPHRLQGTGEELGMRSILCRLATLRNAVTGTAEFDLEFWQRLGEESART